MDNVEQKTLVSLGMSCQTAHQLRRLADNQINSSDTSSGIQVNSGIFDWLICPPKSIIKLLDNGIPDFSKENIQIRKDRPYWTDYNLFFWHNFIVGKDKDRQINIDDTFNKETERWSYLRSRFSELVPAKTIFVVSNTQNNLLTEVFDTSESDQYQFTFSVIEELEHSLARFFNTSVDSIHLEVITRENRSSGLQNKRCVSFFPIDQNEWKGSRQSWDLWWQNLGSTLK